MTTSRKKHVSERNVDNALAKAEHKIEVLKKLLKRDDVSPKSLPVSDTAFAEWESEEFGVEYFNASAWKKSAERTQYRGRDKALLQKKAKEVLQAVRDARLPKKKKPRSQIESEARAARTRAKAFANQVIQYQSRIADLEQQLALTEGRLRNAQEELSKMRRRFNVIAPLGASS